MLQRWQDCISHICVLQYLSRSLVEDKKELKNLAIWEGNTLNDCLENWVKREVVYKTLPAIICWYVWLERNNVLFEGRIPSSFSVVCKVKETLPSGPPLKKYFL
jgi:hypothetical protein